jgi:beta-N-acetylhexosaminidase
MTSLERLALEVQLPGFVGATLAYDDAKLLDEGLAGVCLFGSNALAGDLPSFAREIRDHAADAIVAIDEEGGDVTRLHYTTGSPVVSHAVLGLVDDATLTRDTAAAIGTDLAAAGVNLDFGPVADVNSNPENPVIGVRSFGADPELVARHVTAYVEGVQSAGVAACAKHFPGHGDTHEDSHLALPRVEASYDVLASRELVPFAAAVKAGVAAIMTSHIVVPAIDPGGPATLSAPVLRVLRDELGYDGLIVSDALDMAGASAQRGIPAAAVAALAAGCDLLCLGADKDVALVRAIQSAIVDAVRAGELDESRLAEAAVRVGSLARRTPGVRADLSEERQLAAARAAIRVDSVLPDLTGALMARVETTPSMAVGFVPWASPSVPVDPAAFVTDQPVVLQVRDAHRHHDVLALVDRLPRVVVVEYGWPGPWTSAAPRVCTHGSSLPSRAAVVELLETKGWTG